MTDRVWMVLEGRYDFEISLCAFAGADGEAQAEAYVAHLRQQTDGRRWFETQDYPVYTTAEQAIAAEKSPS